MTRTAAYLILDPWKFFIKEKNVPSVSFRSLSPEASVFHICESLAICESLGNWPVSYAPSCKARCWSGISVNSGFVGNPSRVRLKTGHQKLSFTTFGSPTALGTIWRHPALKPQTLLLSPDTIFTLFCR